MFENNHVINFEIFDFSLDSDILKLLNITVGLKEEFVSIKTSLWAGESRRKSYKVVEDVVDAFKNQQFNHLDFEYNVSSKKKGLHIVEKLGGTLTLSPLNDMWLYARDYKCAKRSDEQIRWSYSMFEKGARWNKKNNINNFPSRLAFWMEFRADVSKDEAEKYVYDRLCKVLDKNVNEYTSGYIGAYEGSPLESIYAEIGQYPKANEELKRKLFKPYKIMFGTSEMFRNLLDIPEAEAKEIQIKEDSKYIVMRFNEDISKIREKYNSRFLQLDDRYKSKELGPDDGVYKFKASIILTGKRINELIEMDMMTEEKATRWKHLVFKEFENKEIDEKDKLYKTMDEEMIKSIIIDDLKLNDDDKKDPVEYHMRVYRYWLSNFPDTFEFIEEYLKKYFSA
ncbi:MAG: hypothetical protein AB6733_14940 [Clostridiaceae bacterium]